MHFELGQHVSTRQQQLLAPKIIQTMEIMQLPLPALEEKLIQELESNICLELVEPEQSENDSVTDSNEDIDDGFEDPDFADMPPRKAASVDGRDPKLDALANIRAKQESLSEQLIHQWNFAEVDEETLHLGRSLIGLIDSDGLLTMPEREMLKSVSKECGVEVSEDKLHKTIAALQNWLEPPGIAARSVKESLLIQVSELMLIDSEMWSNVQKLIEQNFDNLIENKLPLISSSSGMSIEEVKIAIEKMHELSLSPGRLLATDRVLPVIPDAIIEFDDNQDSYFVSVSDGNLPPLRISAEYELMLKDKKQEENAKQFIKRNINSARWIIDAIGQRRRTLGNIVQIVVDKQRDFLDKGDAYLHPLPMVEVANILGIHVATVSRAVADKWIQTPRGIFSLRRFFSGGTTSDKSGDMSWEAVKHRLQEIVDNEDKSAPYSDELLAQKLREQGIEIARRTVVKYRQQLDIPAARIRKKY
ncbi:MAG: RNA polymerase factor sigma-54 [Phycisphaerales bacterium]|jgi:RNA polymerase sigma-54 factor|nr:RNA polymerase factor sigma-54 [Phycisphaerales bacterium]